MRKEEEERKQREEEREKREKSIKIHQKKRKEKEETRKQKKEEAYMKENFPELMDDDDDDDEQGDDRSEESEESEVEEPPEKREKTLAQKLKQFSKIAATGQLFLKYTGKRRRKPQDRIVKVSFDDTGKAKQISWGSGSRHIEFNDILYIIEGHRTPVFKARKDQLDEKLCFSVVGKTQILDVQAQSKEMCKLWVKGLRKLKGQSEDDAEKKAKEYEESGNLPGSNAKKDSDRKTAKEHKNRTKSLMLLQQDLFVMTCTTVFRNLEEERIWDIDQSVRDRFNAKVLYEDALREDVPWREWNHWIREKVVTYLRENNRVAHGGHAAGMSMGGMPPGGMMQQMS